MALMTKKQKRNFILLATGLAVANNIFFVEGIIGGLMNTTLAGSIDVATVLGAIGVYGIWQWKDRKL